MSKNLERDFIGMRLNGKEKTPTLLYIRRE
jgi:hypothetical protein